MTITTTLQIQIYDCNPINFQLSNASVSLELLSLEKTVTWSYTQRHSLCGGYTVTSSNTALVQVGLAQTLTVLTPTANLSTVTLTLTRDSSISMQTTASLQVTIYDCHPTGFALSASTIQIEH